TTSEIYTLSLHTLFRSSRPRQHPTSNIQHPFFQAVAILLSAGAEPRAGTRSRLEGPEAAGLCERFRWRNRRAKQSRAGKLLRARSEEHTSELQSRGHLV